LTEFNSQFDVIISQWWPPTTWVAKELTCRERHLLTIILIYAAYLATNCHYASFNHG